MASPDHWKPENQARGESVDHIEEGSSRMPLDSYSPCPCGSGKKIKFCCHFIADDMDRIVRLMEGNQPRVALQQLELLSKKHPRNPWVETTRAMMLLDLNEVPAARDVLKDLLDNSAENELAIVLYAAAMLRAEGLDKSKKAIHRAFQRSAKKLPALVGDLASSLAAGFASRGQMMAAREHLALALRLASEERRQRLFIQLLELDGADEIPYPMRGSHQLPNITGTDEFQKEVRKGQKYAAVGCWSVAAEVFTTLANASPELAELWHSAGLCRAWDGDEKGAAEALHRAARYYADQGTAIECETLAQLLDEKTTNDVVEDCVYRANIGSVSRLLTALDGHQRCQRLPIERQPDAENPPVAQYLILDKGRDQIDVANLTLDTVPRFSAQVTIYDANPGVNASAILLLNGLRGPDLDDAKALVTSVGGDLLEWSADVPQPEIIGELPAESMMLESHWYLPAEVPQIRRRELIEQHWNQIILEKWPQTVLRALGGKTPEQAAQDPGLRIALCGAIYALDATAQRRGLELGLKRVFTRLGIDPLPALEVTPETSVGGLSIMQLNRLPIDQLTDQQLITVVNRSMLIRHDETLYGVLKVAIAKPSCAEQFDMARIYQSLCEISSHRGLREEAFHWLDCGRKLPAPEGKTDFQQAWAWDMAELNTRLEDPSDPQLQVLLKRFVNYYGPKIPQIRPHIERTLDAYGIPSPWESVDIVTASVMPEPGQMWSPAAQEPVAASGSKLWLPGQ